MRLQLTVKRHGLPPFHVLWKVGDVRLPQATAGNSITISQLLEQVNDVIPLEAEDWGLEDYAVEVRGFECLHFSELSQVLKEDDEVCIRPLQTADLRFRRISGRLQISSDGKHLIDGVAFGRPFLRKADRPSIRIPPRKRRRMTYNEEEDIDLEPHDNDRQMVVRARFDDADDATAGNENENEEDWASDDEDEDLDAEVGDLQADLLAAAQGEEGAQDPRQSRRSRRSPKGLGLLQLVDDSGQPFTGLYNNPLLDLYGQDEPPSRMRAAAKVRGIDTRKTPRISKCPLESNDKSNASTERVSRRSSSGSSKSVRFNNAEGATPATVRESEDSEDSDDDDFEPVEVDESDKENTEPNLEGTQSIDSFFEGSESSSSSSSDVEPSDTETTSSSGSSSSDFSDSSSASEPEHFPTRASRHKSYTVETSLTRSTTGSRNRESKAPRRDQKQKKSHSDATIDVTPDRVENLSSNTIPKTTPPSRGKIKTKKRNERRRESKKLAWLKDRGVLPANATKADYHRFLEENPETAERPTRTANKVQYQDDTESRTIFEAKRQALLNSITYGGIEIGTESSRQDKGVEVTTVDEHRPEHDQALEIPATNDNDVSAMPSDMDEVRTAQPNEGPANESTSSSAIQENSDSMTPAVEIKKSSADDTFHIAAAAVVPSSDAATIMEAPTRRSKLDLSGAKRMLFGSLGLKTPKTKDDESVTRAKLMKDIKPVRELQAKTEVESGADVVAASEDDSWREKIDLRAVECCYDGFELSTPPFPFVQRWDPQQQRGFNFGNARKRKGKKRKRNNENYYEDSFNQMSQNKAARHSDYDSPRHEVTTALPEKNSNVEGYDQERIRDESIQDALAANEQLHQETEDTSADRLVEPDHPAALPTLPEDLSSCESLTREKATAGTIVAFKQLDMSAETNWQPIVSEYRTALVAQVLADGTLQMTLAKRDQPTKQIQFDEKNGNRLYSKFEMPGYSDERAGDDSGMIEISFDELINPVVIKAPIEQKYLNQERQDQVRLATPPELGEITVAGRTKNSIDDPEAYGLDGSMEGVVVDDVSTRPNEEARQEISELMRDAGWRSGVHSDLIDHRGKGSPERKDDLENANLIDPPPPKFHGFSSSPLNRDEVESSPLPPEVQTKKPLYEMDVEVTESVPPHGPIDPDAQSMVSMNRSIVDYPHLPQIGDDSDVFEEGGQQRSDPLGLDHHIASQDLESLGSIYQPQPSSVRSSSRASPKHAATKDISLLDIACSDDELPHLFSQAFEARISQEVDIKPELSEDEAISPPSYRKSRRSGKIDAPQRESNGDWNPRWSDSEDGGSTPRLSQAPMPSQIVDLTVSSDSVSVPDDEYIDGEESYRLPEGSGWVNKNRASKPRSLSKNNFPKKRSARSR